ncbi:hypothetical protein F2Q69_00026416 [Brassica cretica]|uniref:Secreted protein n=1 Tax=Brassica cretica TaxID=69181 RepID=A0A8S9RV15_BRACR|nr:hypothetical protein F2Q69_00026416 [Brassica cretica]
MRLIFFLSLLFLSFFLSSFVFSVFEESCLRVLRRTTVRSSPTIPSSASISSPSFVTLLRIKGIAFFCSVFSRIPSFRSSLIEFLHDDLEAYQLRSSRISRTSLRLLLTPLILRPRRRWRRSMLQTAMGLIRLDSSLSLRL